MTSGSGTPKITIKVGGVEITNGGGGGGGADTSNPPDEESLFVTYFQAIKGEKRYQWVVFPPAAKAFNLGTESDTPKVLHRVQSFAGNRSKWFHSNMTSFDSLNSTLENLATPERGYVIGGTVVVPLEMEDFKKVWEDKETPHKALRAVDRALEATYGYTLNK